MTWSRQDLEASASHLTAAEATLTVGFPNVDWQFLQSVYGWAALQYQGWARGHIRINSDSSQSILLYTNQLLEFWVNDSHYFGGDFYGYGKSPLVLRLAPGCHRLDVRLIRDVRAMGGIGEPKVSIEMRAEGTKGGLAIIAHQLLVSDVVNGRLASPFASVPVRNESENLVEILGVASSAVCLGTNSCIQAFADLY